MSTKKKQPIAPTKEEIPALVDRACELKKLIKKHTAELKDIEARLELAGEKSPQEPLKDKEREGRRAVLRGRTASLPVVFTSDAIIKSFPANSPKHQELLSILEQNREGEDLTASERLSLFYKAPCKWESRYEDGQAFRRAAAEHLPKDLAPKFVAACRQVDKHGIPKSKTVIAYDEAEDTASDGEEGVDA